MATTTLPRPAPDEEIDAARDAATSAILAAFPHVPVNTIGRTMGFLEMVSDAVVGARRDGKAVTPTRLADFLDAAAAKAFDTTRLRQ